MRTAHSFHTHPSYPIGGAEFTFTTTLKSNQGTDDKTKEKTLREERTRRLFIMRKEARLLEDTA